MSSVEYEQSHLQIGTSKANVSRKTQAHDYPDFLEAWTRHSPRCYDCCAWVAVNQTGIEDGFGHARPLRDFTVARR